MSGWINRCRDQDDLDLGTFGVSSLDSCSLVIREVAVERQEVVLGHSSGDGLWRDVGLARGGGFAQPALNNTAGHRLSTFRRQRRIFCERLFGSARITEFWRYQRSRSGPNGQPLESSHVAKWSSPPSPAWAGPSLNGDFHPLLPLPTSWTTPRATNSEASPLLRQSSHSRTAEVAFLTSAINCNSITAR